MGTRQRALLHRAQGVPVDPADEAALAAWERLTYETQRSRIHATHRVRKAIVRAAVYELTEDEVATVDDLAR